MGGVVSLRGGNETIDPREQLFGAVIRVQNDGNSVLFGHGTNMEGTRDGTGNGRSVIRVVKSLSSVELGTTTGELNDDGGVIGTSRFQTGVDTRGGDTVDSRNGVSYMTSMAEKQK